MSELTNKTVRKPTLYERLAVIQKELKAPKNQFNKFGNFNYRSCEDILEAVKPLLKDLVLTINDEIVSIGDRYYVKATAILSQGSRVNMGNFEDVISSSAYAREPESKTGMDASQITGAASSYARKYALNGLFLIDDTKDADTQDNTSSTSTTSTTPKPISLKQSEAIIKIAKQMGEELTFSEVQKWTSSQASDYISRKGNGGYYKQKTEI